MDIYINNALYKVFNGSLEEGIDIINALGDQGMIMEAVSVSEEMYFTDFENAITTYYPDVKLFFWDFVSLCNHYRDSLRRVLQEVEDNVQVLDREVFVSYQLDYPNFERFLISVESFIDNYIQLVRLNPSFGDPDFERLNDLMTEVDAILQRQDYIALSDFLNGTLLSVMRRIISRMDSIEVNL